MCLGAVAYSFLEVMINVCIYLTQKVEEMSFWMQLISTFFGFGGFLGPVIIFVFEGWSYAVFGLLMLTTVPFYFAIKSP